MRIMGRGGRAGVDAPSESPTAPAGWSALYKTVRDTDITKVDDCRDDIDTLLVFAGLYSAVLTAFVVESYTHLQQDPQDVIIGLLQQIAKQNFASGPGFINSTTTSTSPPPFEPPLWAIRVNVLWFTSLLLSLASASFGILVKQWLREYLAIDYAALRERLRARQYRSPAVAQWKVFEIAAFLPLLLQLSLGLFFIGLCFFTAAVHDSIGRTTIPLVCAWLFLLLATTIAPLFSPRCPYKTTFLKSALKVGRCYLGPPLRGILRPINRLILTGVGRLKRTDISPLITRLKNSVDVTLAAAKAVSSGWTQLEDALSTIHDSIPWFWAKLIFNAMLYVTFSPVLLSILAYKGLRRSVRTIRPYVQTLWQSVQTIWQSVPPLWQDIPTPWQCFEFWRQSASSMEFHEEEGVIKTEEEDIGVLLSVDSLVSDDGLLPAMLDALRQQAGASPEKTTQFISRIIGRRIGRDLDVPRLEFIPDLRPLSKFAWSTMTDAIADLLQYTSSPLESGSLDRLFNAVVFLLSPSQFGLSEHACRVLHGAFIAPSWKPDGLCSDGIYFNQCLARARAGPSNALLNAITPTCLRCTMDVYKTLLCQDAQHSHPSLRHLLEMHLPGSSFRSSSHGLLQDLFDTIFSFLPGAISAQKDLTMIAGFDEVLHLVIQYGEMFGGRDDAVNLCRQILPTESGAHTLLVQFAALHPQYRVSHDSQEILLSVAGSVADEDWVRIRSHLTATCVRFCNGGDDSDDDVPLDYVRLCAGFIQWMWNDNRAARALANAIKKYYRTQGWQKGYQHREYWCDDSLRPTHEELFKGDHDPACEVLQGWHIPTELVDALWLFVPEERREELEVTRSIQLHDWSGSYTPRVRPALRIVPEDSGDGKEESRTNGIPAIGDAGLRLGGVADMSQAVEQQVDRETETSVEQGNTGEGNAGGECTEDQDATEHDTVAKSDTETEGSLSCEGSA